MPLRGSLLRCSFGYISLRIVILSLPHSNEYPSLKPIGEPLGEGRGVAALILTLGS